MARREMARLLTPQQMLVYVLTRNRPADVLEVKPMPQQQALDLIRRGFSNNQPFDEASACELLQALDFVSLTLRKRRSGNT